MTTAVAPTGKGSSHRPWNTLRRLKALRLTLLLLDGLVWLLVLVSVQQSREAVGVISRRVAPGIVSAQQIDSSLSAMDAAFAAELLHAPREQGAAVDGYQARRMEVVHGLVNAAEQIADNEQDRQPVETLEVALGDYERLLQRARDLAERDPSAAIVAYRQATTVLQSRLLPAAMALDAIGSAQLQQTSDHRRLQSSIEAGFLTVGGLLFLLVLGASQVFFSRRMHRTLNLPLLMATLVTLAAAVHLGSVSRRAQAALHSSQWQDFASVHRVLHMRSAGLAAFDDESRALLDTAQASSWTSAAGEHAGQIATLPPGLSPEQLLDAVREGQTVEGFSGDLALEAGRGGIPETRDLALTALGYWQAYLAVSHQLLHLAATGERHEAVAGLTGSAPSQLPAQRDRFGGALGAMLSTGQDAFDRDIRDSTSALRLKGLEASAAAALLAGLILLGFEPRVREYR